jgi:hypothetical protein
MVENSKTYLFKYFHEGSEWMLELKASSQEDAQARLNKLSWAKPMGELIAKVPAGMGLFARVACSIRNAIAGPAASA